jgi:hypothetical protein
MEHNHAKWRVNRKLLAQQFPSMTSTTTVTEHVPIIEAESTQLLHEFLYSPKGFEGHAVRFASSVMTSISECIHFTFCLVHNMRAICEHSILTPISFSIRSVIVYCDIIHCTPPPLVRPSVPALTG